MPQTLDKRVFLRYYKDTRQKKKKKKKGKKKKNKKNVW